MARKTDTKKDICFTIMPFGDWCERYYEVIYSPAIKAAGLEPHKANDLYRPSAIVTDIWQYTKKAKIILADLTGKNPNVFYELGLAHAIARPAILITESLEDIPFDLRALRVIEYDKNSPDWGKDLEIKITTAIKEVLISPNESVPATFLETQTKSLLQTVSQAEKSKIQKEQEDKLLELEKGQEMLRREMRRNLLEIEHGRHRPPEMGPAEAVSRIREYMARGMSEELIVERLSDRGVPVGFIMGRIREYRKKNK